MNSYKFPYRYSFKDIPTILDKGTVFSCFACGGGSTIGYKLAGFKVIGCNEIDPKMMEAYRTNLKPQYSYLEPIQEFKLRKDLPEELFKLDILDGSPPCSSFSMAGNREKDWGKEKKFREGQSLQVLDTLFFDFIDVAKTLQPKVVIAENVKGLLLGEARQYVKKIYTEFENAGYYPQHILLDASTMGVPQKRERVFFIALRKDLAEKFLYASSLFEITPYLKLDFNEPPIPFSEFSNNDNTRSNGEGGKGRYDLWHLCGPGENFSQYHPKGHYFGDYKLRYTDIVPTLIANPGAGSWHPEYCRLLDKVELCCAGTFPQDYNFLDIKPKYIIGMSVPPVMIAQIATEIYNQWLSKL